MPFTKQFAQLVEKLFREHAPVYTHGLEPSLLKEPGIVLTACHAAMHSVLSALLVHVPALLGIATTDNKIDLQELKAALNKTHDYIDQIHLQEGDSPHWNPLLALIHALDHLQRLHERSDEDTDRAATARNSATLSAVVHEVKTAMDSITYQLAGNHLQQARSLAEQNLRVMYTHAEPLRAEIMREVAIGKLNVADSTDCLEAIRWLQRVSVHVDRITHHLLVANTLNKQT